MTLQELGESIRARREAAGLSIDDVAARIKISSRILRSIEDGSLVGLPHAVYTKSFIRTFGLLVGYNPEELNAHLDALFPPESLDETRAEPTFRNQNTLSYPSAGRRFAVLLVMLVVLAGLVGGGWYVASNYGGAILELVKKPFSAISGPSEEGGQNKEQPAEGGAATSQAVSNTLSALVGGASGKRIPPPVPAADRTGSRAEESTRALLQQTPPLPQATVPPGTAASSSARDVSPSGSPAPAGVAASGAEKNRPGDTPTGEAASGDSRQTASPAGSADLTIRLGGTGTAAAPSAQGQPAVQPVPGASRQLVILAQEPCWIGPRADGVKGRDHILQAGERYTISYKNALEVTFGNAGGVTVQHNGQDLGHPGNRGQRVVLRFPSGPN